MANGGGIRSADAAVFLVKVQVHSLNIHFVATVHARTPSVMSADTSRSILLAFSHPNCLKIKHWHNC
jgi:hypothetical protein